MVEIDDEKKMRIFYDKRLSEEVPADSLGDDFKGYVLKITGGFDKQGFAMKQGVLLNTRTRLLLDGRTGNYHPRRHGCRKRKSVRGCIVGNDLSCLNLVVVKRGPTDLPKLTDKESDRPSTRGPKRANHIRKVWGLKKTDDVRQYVVRRKIEGKNGKKDRYKSPKIQRLITPAVRHNKARRLTLKKRRHEKKTKEASEYSQLLTTLRDQKRSALLSKKRELKSVKEGERKSTAGGDTKMADAPKPKKDTPKKDTPKKDTPKKDTPKKDTPKKDTPKKDAPKKEAPKKDAPKKDAPKKDAPKDAPKKDVPKDVPKKDVPKDVPKKDVPKDVPKKDAPKKDAPKKDTPKAAAPKAEPKKDTAKAPASKGEPKKTDPKKGQ
jgi:small subunit ribosomal protein S6e